AVRQRSRAVARGGPRRRSRTGREEHGHRDGEHPDDPEREPSLRHRCDPSPTDCVVPWPSGRRRHHGPEAGAATLYGAPPARGRSDGELGRADSGSQRTDSGFRKRLSGRVPSKPGVELNSVVLLQLTTRTSAQTGGPNRRGITATVKSSRDTT